MRTVFMTLFTACLVLFVVEAYNFWELWSFLEEQGVMEEGGKEPSKLLQWEIMYMLRWLFRMVLLLLSMVGSLAVVSETKQK